ncbi:YbjQ family protein [Thalassoglobus sp.]|uniref:YbjQ family protein n=1 Tax=Thalassoglobus sp. TaxID=2795869 RepID=UPI003AA945D5
MDDSLVAMLMMCFWAFLFIGVPLIGIVGGRVNEYRHFKSLERREAEAHDLIVTQIKSFPAAIPGQQPPTLIYAETVIASDYLKTFLAAIRGIFGGEVRSFQKMQDRARRESLLRLIDSARQQGYNAICNVRLETADVGGGAMTRGKQANPMAAILASATAYHASTAE